MLRCTRLAGTDEERWTESSKHLNEGTHYLNVEGIHIVRELLETGRLTGTE